jgi:hypothetical protein
MTREQADRLIAEWQESGQSENAFNAAAWGNHALWAISLGPLDESGRLAYERARLAGHFGNLALDEIEARKGEA